MSAFRVRKLDLSTAVDTTDPRTLPEIKEVEEVLGKAFTGDYFTAVVLGHDDDGDTSGTRPFHTSMVVAGLLGGEVYVAETADTDKIAGCAVWFGPGRAMYDSEAQREHALKPFMESLSPELQAWWKDVLLPKYDAFVTAALGEGTKLAAWHLQTLGVDPAYQGQGVGKLLVNTIVEKSRATGAHPALCVECATETNIKIYTKIGFRLMPKDNTGPDSCKTVYTGIKGNSTPNWALLME
ncbi:hypothetical protein DFH08DRAFT_839381 [Mycena albidolilacea]|uniref:N-acetyltransferase domain-containing protein n=1 Tax=Mycena albidolilacea TaxID=1033008 RepID=A0AAD7F4C6_9AGAR|nr:hypothetical protein DFH08DRAFT_839381 [Mycena albidolilacea]